MSRWKSLPESLEPETGRLVVRLRQVKDRSGLSLTALAARTAFSKSSWERYLNGKALPPRQAVEELARACGADPVPLVALWEVAEAAAPPAPPAADAADTADTTGTAGTAGTATDPEAPVDPDATARAAEGAPGGPGDPSAPGGPNGPPPPGRGRRRPLVLAALAAGVVAVAAGIVAFSLTRSDGSADPDGGGAAPSTAGTSPTTYPCLYSLHDGERYAGHSTTHEEEFGPGSNGEPIAEVQCLVLFHDFDPGAIDGIYGPNTRGAVEEFQRSRGLDADGIVGPMTWQELRSV